MKHSTRKTARNTIGVDIGDRDSSFYVLDPKGEFVDSGRIPTRIDAFRKFFSSVEPSIVALETGTHSLWITWLLEDLGHEVLLANARELRMIFESKKKNDKIDAQTLCRAARFDRKLLHLVKPRTKECHADLMTLRSRSQLVKVRSLLILHVRGVVKSFGERIPACSAEAFHHIAPDHVPGELSFALKPILTTIADLTKRIRAFDRRIERELADKYPETKRLRQVPGVGPITALFFVLLICDPERFRRSRYVGSYVGLAPRLDQSGKSDRQCRITKAGDDSLRTLLVSCAQYILGRHGPDSDLRRFGQGICQRGGKNAKKRAAVAVARKVAVLLHRLWITGATYEPLRNSRCA